MDLIVVKPKHTIVPFSPKRIERARGCNAFKCDRWMRTDVFLESSAPGDVLGGQRGGGEQCQGHANENGTPGQ